LQGCGDRVGQDVRIGRAQGCCTWPEVEVAGRAASPRHWSQRCEVPGEVITPVYCRLDTFGDPYAR
jgi:hypothetical protein